jgi:deoxyadenosine/deoxycytidine kinase
VDAGWLGEVARAYGEFFFHWEETPLLVVNTSDVDLVGDADDQEALLTVIRKHRKGTQHYVPMGTQRG